MLFFFFLAVLLVLWALSSLTRDQTWSPALEAWSPNHWTARESLKYIYYFYLSTTPCFSLFVQAAITKYHILVCVCVQLVSHVQLFATCQAPLSVDSAGKNTGMDCYFLFQLHLILVFLSRPL